MRKIIQMFESGGDACALASDGTLWWLRPYGTGQAPGWQPWADGLPQPEDNVPDPSTLLARMAEAIKTFTMLSAEHEYQGVDFTHAYKLMHEALAEYEAGKENG